MDGIVQMQLNKYNHEKRVQRIGRRLMWLGIIGVLTSAYGVYVKHQKHLYNDGYAAICDSEYFSCSKVMTSEYGSLLLYHGLVEKGSIYDVPNALLGVFAYSLFVLFPVLRKFPLYEYLYLLAALCALALSVYLAFILSIVLRDLCIICVTAYLVNIGLFWNSLLLVNNSTGSKVTKPKKK